ncbi:MAG: Type 1 glutamine amidotransferase-like domain-containing protein [Acidimicrobiales bacterium]
MALVGGNEWHDGCIFDQELLAASGAEEVVVLPTAAAYEHPERDVARAREWFSDLGVGVRPLMVLRRPDATDDTENVSALRAARFIYLSGGSALHLRSVMKDSPLWDALVAAWKDGAVVAGSSAGAMVLCDPMVDPRGGAFTLGLGMMAQLAVIPHHDTWSPDKARRTIELAPAGLPIVAIDERTALVRSPDGAWSSSGAGRVVVFRNGAEADLGALP